MMDVNLEGMIRLAVDKELENSDIPYIVQVQLQKFVSGKIEEQVGEQIKSTVKIFIEDEIHKALSCEVITDDGWGKKTTHKSFEDLFRASFKKAMDDKYEVKKMIENLVHQRVNSLIKQEYDKALEKITDEITKSRIVKK